MMRFADTPPDGDETYASAARRLDQARDEQRRLAHQLAVTAGTPAEGQAARALEAGRADVAARETWLVCVERGV